MREPITLNVELKGNCDVLHPVFAVTRGEHGYFNNYNYCYVPDFGRYYFISPPEVSMGGIMVLHCTVDALTSWAGGIRGLRSMIERQEFKYNPYMHDNLLPIANGSIIDTINVGSVIPTGATRTMYITCIGGIDE